MARFIKLNCSGAIMNYLCSFDVNFSNRPLCGLTPCFVCYLVQAAHGKLVRLPDMMTVYTAHVSGGVINWALQWHDTQLFWSQY